MPFRRSRHDPAGPATWLTVNAGFEAVGDSLARTLLPIVAVSTLGAGTAAVGVINSLGLLAFLLLSMPLGIHADRSRDPQRFMETSTILRAAVAVSGAAAWLAGWLQGTAGLALLVGMAAIIGVADVVYASGLGLLIPRMVAKEDIREIVGRVQSASQAGNAAGPVLLSGLLALVAPPLAWLGSTAAYLASWGAQRRFLQTPPGGAPARRTSSWNDARNGASLLLGHPLLARVTIANMLNNASVMSANTLLPVVALHEFKLSPTVVAMTGTAGALAGILGALLGARITSIWGLRLTRLATAAAATLATGLVITVAAFSGAPPHMKLLAVASQACIAGAATSIALVAGSDLAPRLIPQEQLGVVQGAQRTLTMGVMPVAALVSGWLGAAAGLPTALAAWGLLTLASGVPFCKSSDPQET